MYIYQNLLKYSDDEVILKLYELTNDIYYLKFLEQKLHHKVYSIDDEIIVLSDIMIQVAKGWMHVYDNYNNYMKLKITNKYLQLVLARCKDAIEFKRMKDNLSHVFKETIIKTKNIVYNNNVLLEYENASLNVCNVAFYEEDKLHTVI